MSVAPAPDAQGLLPEALLEAERSFAMVTDAIDDHAIFMITRDGTIATWNSGAQRMKGFAPEEIIGAPYSRLFDLTSPDALGATEILAVAAAQGRYKGEGWRLRKDGTRFLANFTLHAIRDATGLVIGFAKITRDVSEQRTIAARLVESERAYRLLADHASDIIARIDLDGVRRYVSPACRKVFGYEPEELIGTTPLSQIHPDDRARLEERVRALLHGATGVVARYRQQHRAGHYVWMETSFQLVRDPVSDEPTEYIGVARDISRHHGVELEAAATEARLQEHVRLLEMAEQAAQLGHWRLDARDLAMSWSNQVFRIHGLVPGEAPELAAGLAAYHPDDREMVQAAVDAAVHEGAPFAFRARLQRADGTIAHVASLGQVSRAPDGTILEVFGTFQDISEQVAAEARLSAALEEAKVAERAKADFLATMSHEIRTPMTGVLGMIELLRAENPVEVRETLFATLDRSTRTLMRILDDVLVYSQSQSGELALHFAPFDLRALAVASIELFRNTARGAGLALVLEFPATPAWLVGDAARLQQILFNLLGNAIKFTTEGSVTLSVAAPNAPGGDWTIRVRDTGIGLPDEAETLLFRPFAQGDATVARRFGGTGLGLAISRKLAEAMGGTLRVEPVADSGACLRLDLPFAEAEKRRDATLHVLPAVTRARDVLVAEDHPANRLLFRVWLRGQGHRVRCVADGQEAVAAAATGAFDVVLMDLQMPVLDGIGAIREIRALAGPAALTPIIALSADVLSDRDATLGDLGVVDRLAKPVDFTALAACLAALPEVQARPAIVLDPARLEQLAGMMDAAELRHFLALSDDEVSGAPARIVATLREGDIAAAARLAHRSIGALENIGATALIAALRLVTPEMAPDAVASPIVAIAAAAAATRARLSFKADV